MDKVQAAKRINELIDIIRENNQRYYVENAPVISDFEYDHLMYELEALEREFPELAKADSPTKKVGSDLGGKDFPQHPHRYPMLSLSNTYSIEEIEAFAARAEKNLSGERFSYSCELKFDGAAICLLYKDGLLYRALTRGDGIVGDEVTDNIRQISNIPQRLKGEGWPEEFEIRGEIVMPYEAFDRLNEERELNEDNPFANPRNAASGSLKLQDSKEVAHRGLHCILYHILGENLPFKTHDEALKAAGSWGLPVSDKSKVCRDINEIEDYIRYWDAERKYLPYATDGIVIKLNELHFQTLLGYTAKSPRWATAFKFQAERALSRLRSIDYQVGRTGAVTPVANLEPVQLSGTVVKRATLVNEDQMKMLDLHLDDYVYVEKGGEIIPKITGVELSKRSPGAKTPVFPQFCPDCGTPLVRAQEEARHYCPNSDHCPMQIKGKLVHFISRKAMNVLAGVATIDQLYNLNLVKSPADFFKLTQTQLLSLEGWKEKSAKRFLDSLSKTVNVPFERVLYALGIRHVGESTAKELARHFGEIERLASATEEELAEVKDVGGVIAKSIKDYFQDAAHLEEIAQLRAAGLQFSLQKAENKLSFVFQDQSIVISGNFSIPRDAMKALIEAHGGKNSGSVSRKTAMLLAGSSPGPEKIRKAQDLGVRIVSEEEFMALLPKGEENIKTQDVKKEPEQLTLF